MADDEIPPEVHHYSSLQEVPWDIQKYAPFPPRCRKIREPY